MANRLARICGEVYAARVFLLRFLLPIALALGSVIPHCAVAIPDAGASVHHAGGAHGQHVPADVPASDACIGCAAPRHFVMAVRIVPLVPALRSAPSLRAMAPYHMSLDPPPPRILA